MKLLYHQLPLTASLVSSVRMRYTTKSMIRPAKLKRRIYYLVARYFRFFANISLKRWRPRIVAVTGSVGKTTLLNLLEVQLGSRAHYSHGANSAFGVALDVLGLQGVTGSKLRWLYLFLTVPVRGIFFAHRQELYVVEIDGDRPFEAEFLASWLRPEVTLWVSVGRSHASNFEEIVRRGEFASVDDAILYEFAKIPRHTTQRVIYDGDNRQITDALKGIQGITKIAVTKDALEGYTVWPDKTVFIVKGITYTFTQPLPRETYVQLALMAELADYLGEPVASNMDTFEQPAGRSNFFAGKHNTQLIDSTYNAHMMSMESIIRMYREMHTDHKWIVVGDIIEQGKAEPAEHARLGEVLRDAAFERYILVGRRTQCYTYPQLDPLRSVTFLHPKDAANYLEHELTGGETILFKGSQYLEGIVEYLLANPDDAVKLPRQEPAAKKRRAKWGLT